MIPDIILRKAPSAELRPDQKDSDSLPEYEVLDNILYHYIEQGKDAAAIAEKGYSRSLVDEVIRLTDRSEFKRAQRSEEDTSELQSRGHLVCRLLLENKQQNA